MKKLMILALALCAALCAGSLVASDAAVEVDTTLELADVLPGTVLDEMTAEAGPWCSPGPYYCLDVWDPVTCSNGVTYSNQCYADRACATGCVPGGATS